AAETSTEALRIIYRRENLDSRNPDHARRAVNLLSAERRDLLNLPPNEPGEDAAVTLADARAGREQYSSQFESALRQVAAENGLDLGNYGHRTRAFAKAAKDARFRHLFAPQHRGGK